MLFILSKLQILDAFNVKGHTRNRTIWIFPYAFRTYRKQGRSKRWSLVESYFLIYSRSSRGVNLETSAAPAISSAIEASASAAAAATA